MRGFTGVSSFLAPQLYIEFVHSGQDNVFPAPLGPLRIECHHRLCNFFGVSGEVLKSSPTGESTVLLEEVDVWVCDWFCNCIMRPEATSWTLGSREAPSTGHQLVVWWIRWWRKMPDRSRMPKHLISGSLNPQRPWSHFCYWLYVYIVGARHGGNPQTKLWTPEVTELSSWRMSPIKLGCLVGVRCGWYAP